MTADRDDLELLIRRVIREEAGVTAVVPAEKWRGGTLVLRNRLRTLEQHINSAELPDDVKVKLQAYISGCYGTLTSFNVLFAEEEDQFKGAGGD